MNATDAQNDTVWRNEFVPVSTRFDDPYFSFANGLAETRHVFIAGNDLPARFRDGFQIAELGFGTGLNALAAAYAWQKAGCDGGFGFTSFERFPMGPDDIEKALRPFEDLHHLARPLVQAVADGTSHTQIGPMTLSLVIGDARETVPHWAGQADAWFLDGFSPAKNPEMWAPDLMAAVGAKTSPGGTFATYTAAGHVRRSLAEAGFAVDRVAGFAGKRHMSVGRR